MPTTHAVGIDLGTTLSAVAYVSESGQTMMVRNAAGEILTPSVVYFGEGEVLVGREARKLTGVHPHDVAECVKRDMGKKLFHRPVHGQKLPPQVIQACVLEQLKKDAVATLGENIRAVITVPAFFDERRRKATADAGEMAGLDLIDIVNEPTAAALAYGEQLGYLTTTGAPREELKVLVYDLGGGTFDVTVIHLRPGDLKTLATDGDVRLGGRDWDQRLADCAATRFMEQYGEDPRGEPQSTAELMTAAEEAKKTLSVRTSATFTITHFGKSLEVRVTRDEFEEMTEDLLERTAYTTRQVLSAARVTWDDIGRILLVGGSSRMPMVVKMIEGLSSITPDHSVNPDEAVARGAAVYAAYRMAMDGEGGRRPDFRVVDVNSHSLGIEGIDQRTDRKENIILIPRNTSLPARVCNRFVTKMDGQQTVVIKVLEGESPDPAHCIPIGKAVLRDLPSDIKKGHPIEVAYRYGISGRLDVRARVLGHDREVAMELQRDGSLSDERMDRWKQVITSQQGFTAFENAVEETLGIDEGGSTEGKASADSSDRVLSTREALARDVKWSGDPELKARKQGAVAGASQTATPAQPMAVQRATPAATPEIAGAENPRPQLTGAAEPVKASGKKKTDQSAILLIGYVVSAAIGLALGYAILRILGIELF